jgi:prepilin-type N-terminal cleavage/methylation domain-containing protein
MTRGFTLVEILISLALAGLVVAGAFQLHATFQIQGARQQQIAEMQQALRVADQVIARYVRSAGQGMNGGKLDVSTCAGPVTYYGAQFSNSNVYADPKTSFDDAPADAESGDPDWLRIIAGDPSSRVAGTGDNGTNLNVADTSGWSVGDLFIVPGANGVSCMRMVTRITGAHGGSLQHNDGQGLCVNPPPGQDGCMGSVSFPAPVFRATTSSAVFRVDNTTNRTTPRLMVTFDPPGTGASPTWQPLADNIEDLQIAFVLSDGTVCGRAGNSVDDPALCDPTRVRAIRYTLVARSSSTVPGFTQGHAGGFEDEPQAAAADGYLRRSLTSEIEVRNSP